MKAGKIKETCQRFRGIARVESAGGCAFLGVHGAQARFLGLCCCAFLPGEYARGLPRRGAGCIMGALGLWCAFCCGVAFWWQCCTPASCRAFWWPSDARFFLVRVCAPVAGARRLMASTYRRGAVHLPGQCDSSDPWPGYARRWAKRAA